MSDKVGGRAYVVVDGYPVKFYGLRLSGYNELRLFLIKKYKVCYFCGKQVKDYSHIDGIPQRPDLATIDHLEPRQIRKRYQVVEKVLACYECNQNRNDYVQRNRTAKEKKIG